MEESLANDKLFDCLEANDLQGVIKALGGKANPNARKRVILTCDVYEESKMVKSLFGREEKERGSGKCQIGHQRAQGESALALAIVNDSVRIVQALLEAGANPNDSISWTVARGHDVWITEEWENLRQDVWDFTYMYDNAVAFALCRGKAIDCHGNRASTVEYLASKGQLWMNQRGGLVKLRNPEPHHTFVTRDMIMNGEIVNLLLDHGGKMPELAPEQEKFKNDGRGRGKVRVVPEPHPADQTFVDYHQFAKMPFSDSDFLGCAHLSSTSQFDSLEFQSESNSSNSLRSADFALQTAIPSYAPDIVVTPIHIDISLDFSQGRLKNKSPHAVIATTFARSHAIPSESSEATDPRFSSIKLNGVGFENLAVSGDDIRQWYYNGEVLEILWSKPFAPGESRKVVKEYDVTEPLGGMRFWVPDTAYPTRPLHCFTQHETEMARYWLACVDYPQVRTTLSIHLKHDSNLTSVTNGTPLRSTTSSDNTVITHWQLDQLCPSYLIAVAVGEFIEVDDGTVAVDGGREMPVKYYATTDWKKEDVFRAFQATKPMVQWLEKKIGVNFPWSKYYQLCSPLMGGAMENISIVTWGDTFIMDENLAREYQLAVDGVNIHEMAHTYFGDLLVIRHFEHAWLKESWATYIEACWIEDTLKDAPNGKDEWYYILMRQKAWYADECSRYVRPIVERRYDSSWNMFDQHTYPGGSWRIHMLRAILGDAAFWEGVKLYVTSHQQKAVETVDFRRALEATSGLNLVRFFDQWITSGIGFPKLKGTWEHDKARGVATLILEQTQGSAKWTIFDLEVEIQVILSDGLRIGTATWKGGQTRAVVHFDIGKDVKPIALRVDPGCKVLFELDMNPGEDILAGTVSGKEIDVRNKLWAYSELIKAGGVSPMRKVETAILTETFYGLRREVADLLSRSKTRWAASILAKMLTAETDPRATWVVARSCINVRHETIRAALLQFFKREDLTYRAKGFAYEALASQREQEDFSFIMKIGQDTSDIGQHGYTRAGAIRALALLRTPESFDYLMTRLTPGLEYERIRPVVVNSIASSALWQDPLRRKNAVDLLADYVVLDNSESVRMACIDAFVDLDAKNMISRMETAAKTFVMQSRPSIERRVARLREAGPSGKLVELKKEMEILVTKVKKLEEWAQEQQYNERLQSK
ncbi:hypothetical protein HDU93_001940 [Gonapodya sp. JEL0774]|nr:hypothetical protein HDU93_001940 [Gonapodya sp. JEL0774]